MSQKGFAAVPIFVIVLLLTGITGAVYLSQKPQVFTPKAAVTEGRFGSTPISQIGSKPANSIKLWPGQVRIDNADEFNFAAGHYDYVLVNGTDNEAINSLKAVNPNIKILAHVGGIVTQAPGGGSVIYDDLNIDEANFLHEKANPSRRLRISTAPDSDLLNLSRGQTRLNVMNAYRKLFQNQPKIDGFVLDGYHPFGVVECAETPECGVDRWPAANDFWLSGFLAINKEIKDNFPDKVVVFNGFNPVLTRPYGPSHTGFADGLDGIDLEHAEYLYYSPDWFKSGLETLASLANQNKKIFFNAEPGLSMHSMGNAPVPVKDLNLERFYLATFLLFNNNSTTYFAYVPIYPENDTDVYFYKDWYTDFGTIQDVYRSDGQDLFYRHYTYGLVVVNPTDQPKTYNFPDNLTYYDWELAGPAIKGSVLIFPKSGHFFLKSENLPKFSPTPSPSPAKKIGDMDNDGDVDIRDFNAVVSYYQAGDLKADLNNDGRVDVYDFNLLIKNFGK